MFVTLEVLKLLTSNVVALLSLNIWSIYITLEVSNVNKSILVAWLPSNIPDIETIGLPFIYVQTSLVSIGSVELGFVSITPHPSSFIANHLFPAAASPVTISYIFSL